MVFLCRLNLGKDEWVCDALISPAGVEAASVGSAVEKPHTGTNTPIKVSIIGGNTPADMGVTGWRELGKLPKSRSTVNFHRPIMNV